MKMRNHTVMDPPFLLKKLKKMPSHQKHNYLEQKQAELEAKLDRIEKVTGVRQRRAIDLDIQRRNFEHYEITKVSTLNKHHIACK